MQTHIEVAVVLKVSWVSEHRARAKRRQDSVWGGLRTTRSHYLFIPLNLFILVITTFTYNGLDEWVAITVYDIQTTPVTTDTLRFGPRSVRPSHPPAR